MILYDLSWGLFPGRVTIYLVEKGSLELERRDTWNDATSTLELGRVRTISPAGKVPILITDEGVAVTQSRAILEYLEERFPEPNMLGSSLLERARTRELMDILDEAATHFATWCQHASPIFIGRVEQIEGAGVQARRDYFRTLALLDRMASPGPFLTGARLTLADCMLGATLRFAAGLYGVQLPAENEQLGAIYDRLLLRPSMAPPRFPAALVSAASGLDRRARETS
jgi:glutathione S-transferase